MKYIALLSTAEFITLIRHGYLENKEIFSIYNQEDFSFILYNSNPFRYEFDMIFLELQEKDLCFTNVKSFHPLTENAKLKMQDDFPSIPFSEPLGRIDLDKVLRFNRSKEIIQINDFLSKKIGIKSVSSRTDLSSLQQDLHKGMINPKGRNMIETTILFNETDNYPDNYLKYYMRLGEIYILSQMGHDGMNFQKSDAYKKWSDLKIESNNFHELSTLLIESGESFKAKIFEIKEEFSTEYFEVIPIFLKFKECIQKNNYIEAKSVVNYLKGEKEVSLFIELVSGLFNFNVIQSIFFNYIYQNVFEVPKEIKSDLVLEITNEEKLSNKKPPKQKKIKFDDKNNNENNIKS